MKQTGNTQARTKILKLINISEMAHSLHTSQQKVGVLCNGATIYRVLERTEEEVLIHKFIDWNGIIQRLNNWFPTQPTATRFLKAAFFLQMN